MRGVDEGLLWCCLLLEEKVEERGTNSM